MPALGVNAVLENTELRSDSLLFVRLQGMSKAYATLKTLLETRFGVVASSATPNLAVGLPGPATDASSGIMSFLQGSQVANPAALVVMVAMFVLLWRMAMLDALALQVLQRLAQRTSG